MVANRVSPDALVQVAFQLSYVRFAGKVSISPSC